MTAKAEPARSAEVIASGASVAPCEENSSSAPPNDGDVIGAPRQEAPPNLSKSKVLAGLQCQRRLWLECFAPELAGEPDPSMVAILERGTEIGPHAHALFPGGVLVDERDFPRALAATRGLCADPSVPAIFEAAFEHDGVRIRVDVLERLDGGQWGLREVKSSTAVDEVHLDDVAVQWHVLAGNGLGVSSVELIHVDTRYVRGDGPIDWRMFFERADVMAAAAERRPQIPAMLAPLRRTLTLTVPPDVEPSGHCSTPHECQFWAHCTRTKPADWIHYLPRVRARQKEALRAAGIERISEIPDDVELGEIPARIRDVLRTGRPFVSPDLVGALAGFGPPAYYLDFETMNPGIPLYSGTHPYERIPFQFSLHHVDGAGSVVHDAFLADGRSDPRRLLAEALLAAVETDAEPILVYSGFEASVLSDLAGAFPDLASQLESIVHRLRDLLPVIRTHVYHPDFRCSFSLKSVAPALVSGFGYSDLEEIGDGGSASEAFHRVAAGRESDQEPRVRRSLLAYCERDTLALVELHRILRDCLADGLRRSRGVGEPKVPRSNCGRNLTNGAILRECAEGVSGRGRRSSV